MMMMMNLKAVVAAVAIVAASSAVAETKQERCTLIGKLAAVIMEKQDGVDMSSLMEIAETELVQRLVIFAYEMPRYSSEDYKRTAVQDFANEAMGVCYGSDW